MFIKIVGFKFKFSDFKFIICFKILEDYINDFEIIKYELILFFENEFEGGIYCLVGVLLSNLILYSDNEIFFNLFMYEKFIIKLWYNYGGENMKIKEMFEKLKYIELFLI